ncbi:MAG: universal stress protein [Methanobacteriota archaeon]
MSAGAARSATETALPAFRRILAATDGGPASTHVAAWARDIAIAFGGRVLLAHVIPPQDPALLEGSLGARALEEIEHARETTGRTTLERAATVLRTRALGSERRLAWGPPADEIARLSATSGSDLVIVGSHRRGTIGRLALGSVADAVSDHVGASLLVAKGPPRPARLLAAYDGAVPSRRAAMLAAALARAWQAHLTILHAFPPPVFDLPSGDALLDLAFHGLQPLRGRAGISWDVAIEGAADAILERAARLDAGLVSVGSRGRSGIGSVVAGSLARRVAHEARASVLIVKGGTK